MAKIERIQLRMSTKMKEELHKAAKAENRTMTNYIETLICRALDGKEEEQDGKRS